MLKHMPEDKSAYHKERVIEPLTEKDQLLDTKAEPDTPDDGSTPFDDDKTSRAIDDIVVNESDELLMAQDAAMDSDEDHKRPSTGWWHKKWLRGTTLFLVLGGAIAAFAVPVSRYWLLNTAGVRVSASVVVVDGTTQLPLKGVEVNLGDGKVKTNGDGKAALTGLKLGAQNLTVIQAGFASVKRSIVLGWGSNPLDKIGLRAVGTQYTIEVRDYLSDKPIEGVEATSGDATAISDKNGKITLTVASSAATKDPVSLSKVDYRTEQITLNDDPKTPNKASLVLARKAVFVTKSGGKYDVMKSDIDGQNKAVLLAGTGAETTNISLVTSSDGTHAAFVSTRDNKRDSGGFLLSSLVLIDVGDGSTVTIAESPQIKLVDWIGSRLVFQQVASDTSDSSRYKVTAYNYADNTRVQLAAANKLNSVLSARGAVFYAVAADSTGTGFYKINADGTSKQTILGQEIWTVLRTAHDTLDLQGGDKTWYTYSLTTNQAEQVDSPSSLLNRAYVDNADRSKSLWLSQGTLKTYDIASTKETILKAQSGIAYPLQWLSANAIMYRLATAGETADYAISLDGGEAHKVADVASAYGFQD